MEPITDDELEAEIVAQNKKDMRSATARTAVPVFWTVLITYLVKRWFNIELTEDQAIFLAPVVAGVAGVVYRLARELEVRFPRLGRILLGSNRAPVFYDTVA